MNKPPSKPAHRPKKSEREIRAEPERAEPEFFDLLYNSAGLPAIQGAPDPSQMYAFAVRELAILSRCAPDLEIKLEASKTLLREFSPKAVAETQEDLDRRRAVVEIETILQAKGIAPPETEPPIELETS